MIKIGTHNGPFHADDVFAVAALQLVFVGGPDVEVVRTRDPKVLATCDYVVDVGDIDEAFKGRFDHHQREGKPEPRPNGVPYSSFGLVWRQFGGEVSNAYRVSGEDSLMFASVAAIVDRDLVQSIDALDNGYGTYAAVAPGVQHATISSMISSFNPTWQEYQKPDAFDAAFEFCVEYARRIVIRAVASAKAEVAAKNLVRTQVGQEIIVIDQHAPVMDTIIETSVATKFLVFPSPGGEWMVQCVPPEVGSFAQRKPLPEAWAGKRGADLDAVTGLTGGVFCHAGRFICGATTKDGAIALAKLALV